MQLIYEYDFDNTTQRENKRKCILNDDDAYRIIIIDIYYIKILISNEPNIDCALADYAQFFVLGYL